MEAPSFLLYLVSVVGLLVAGVGISESVVWGPREGSGRGRGEIEPTLMEIPDASEEALSAAAEKVLDPIKRLYRRDVPGEDQVGYTTPIHNDPHSFALVHWTGYPSEALFILTRQRTRASGYTLSEESWLWRSLDYGHTFHNDTVKWDNDTVIEWYYISPYSQYLIFADRIHHRLYVTDNEGDSYTRYNISFRPDKITFQSRNANRSMEEPYRRYVLGYDSQNRSLWVSIDLGMNWRKLSDNVVENHYYWRRMPGMDGLGTVYFEKNISNSESQLYIVRDVDGDAPELFDPSLGNFMKNTFVLALEYMFVQKVNSGSGGVSYSSPLWVSHNRQPFMQARFPLQTEERHYAVVDASEGQVFIAVYHDINNTNLYLSEVEGLNYSLSLQYIISPPESDWTSGYPRFDVHVVEGIVGTYIANQKVPGSRYGASVISYDKGGGWVRLTAPPLDYRNQPQICAPPDCSLHLHIERDRINGYQSILSQDSAVGLLMALGNLGASLSTSSVRLYFSRDGGFTWFEVDTGFWEFQFAALGSVVVSVRKRRLTNTIKWSCDEGRSWQQTQFTNTTGIYVIGMLTEREEKARHVTIFGYEFSRREWLIVDLNFTSVVPNQCADEDYFVWVPTDERPGSRCLLGEVITYERRNSSFCCFVEPLYDRPVGRTSCNCSIEDFECDFGFERLSLNSPCTALPWLQWPSPPPDDCTEGSTYNITSGYRRVAGDKCVRGTEDYFFELVRDCPVLPPKGLLISHGSQGHRVNHTITFSLTQLQGGRLSTWYVWDFNDTSAPENVTGFASASTRNHTFIKPGHFAISVLASNNGGSSQTLTELTVYDVVMSVSILPPIQARSDGSVPAGIQLLFTSSLTTQYNTTIVGDITYEWTVGDGRTIETTESFISHTFPLPNSYTISLRVVAAYSRASVSTYHLTVYESAKHVLIVNKDLQQGHWVEASALTSFTVQKSPNYHETIPADTFYTWHLVPANGLQAIEKFGRTFNYTFPMIGRYDLSVVGNHSSGSFSTQISITAEYYFGGIDILYIPTVRTGGQAAVASVRLKKKGSLPYLGTFSYQFTGGNGENYTSTETIVTDGSVSLHFNPVSESLSQSRDIQVTLTVWNHISKLSVSKSVGVVVPGDYGSISLMFDVSKLPSTFNTSAWMTMLKDAIVISLGSYSVNSSQIEIESTMVATVPKSNDTAVTPATPEHSPAQRSHNILKRSVDRQVLLVYLNILPLSASAENISLAKTVTNQLANTGTLVVVVNNTQLSAEAVLRATDRIIVEPGEVIKVNNWKLYSGIAGGLAVVLIVGVVVSVALGVVIYYYRRRYQRLCVRYSRLSQAPVRFTFTQSGDMIEEDDPDVKDEDTTCAEFDDNDEKPLKEVK